ncbi:hypothetical protein [Rossellomorea aquimaris]|uniref:hypothetical protein n=1 Tax=Rossellomorea aquimaris TaxID=189382 RepID=UPI001CFD217B|nr:hypothetical protein [Rossellomorea aquimaris]
MKKLIAVIFLFASVGVYLVINFPSDERKVKEYAENEYGIDVEVKKVSNEGFGSDDTYVVFPENHEDLEFAITFPNGDGVITDNYARALAADEKLHQLKKVMPGIKDLGFGASDNGKLKVSFVKIGKEPSENKYLVNLSSPKPIKIAKFEKEDLNRYFKLLILIQESRAEVNRVYITDKRGPVDRNTIALNMDKLKNVKTKEDLLFHLKRFNWEFASYYANKKWESEKEKIENGRFRFGSEYDDYWFRCGELNEQEECTSILALVKFKENSLNKQNVYLKEDLTSILHFFDRIAPMANIEYRFTEEGSNESKIFTEYEIKKYHDISAFIDKNLK